MNIIFMGSPDFAVPSLNRLAESDNINIQAVVSQPDRKKGRGQKLHSTPVKKRAVELGLEVMTSENVNREKFIDKVKKISPEAIVVVAFGQKLSEELLFYPDYGSINLHASLLPKYRGSSPIHRAIINGDNKTGVTTMYMDENLDSGDIIYKANVEIGYDDTVGKLHDRLALVGSELLLKTLIDLKKGKTPREKQDDNLVSYAPKIDKSLGKIDWNLRVEDIYNLVRGVNPWPGAYTELDGQNIKIWKVSIVERDSFQDRPGEILSADSEEGLIVQTGSGIIKIDRLQPSGKRKMSTKAYLRGNDLSKGSKFS